ncbi:hypothetical protein [Sphingomonas fuzhouensis]|uniref:hypothetical protein n=1 Tax=Sphingomonas fuzhouensis TaxID=3106033 RepID=UPI002AFE40EF|nr:hypothetical protein [Sphingomonas sp. SGZ-02]
MRRPVLAVLSLLASLGVAPGAWAQAGASSAADPIVVTARPLPPRRETLRWFGAISGYPSGDSPLSRLTEPLCIGSAGLAAKAALPIADRILGHAERLGIRLGGDKCRPNVLILFVDHGAQQIQWLIDHRPGIFGNLPYSDIRAMAKDKGPVHAWHLTAITSRDGDQLILGAGNIPTLNIPSASRITLSTKSHIAAAVVMIDRDAVNGKTINQIADYATMRALAVVRPRKADGIATILTLFDHDAEPEGLTPFDWGYLRGLYSGEGNQKPGFQYAAMARFIDEEIKAGDKKP